MTTEKIREYAEICGFNYVDLVISNHQNIWKSFQKAIEEVTAKDIPAVDICFKKKVISNGILFWEVYDDYDVYIQSCENVRDKPLKEVMRYFQLTWDDFVEISHENWGDEAEELEAVEDESYLNICFS